MTATAHALVGGAIAASVPNPAVGITLAFVSHPLLDMIPHWDFGRGWRQKTKLRLFIQASLDLLIGSVVAFILFGTNVNFWYFSMCILAAELMDILEIPYWFFNWKFPPFGWIYKIQHEIQGKAKLPWGILTQAAAVGLIFYILQIKPV